MKVCNWLQQPMRIVAYQPLLSPELAATIMESNDPVHITYLWAFWIVGLLHDLSDASNAW